MSTLIIKKDKIFIQKKKNFTKSWKPAYLYILKEDNKSFLVLFKSSPNLSDYDIRKYRKERKTNIIVSKRITSRVVVNKMPTIHSKLTNIPTCYIFSVEFSLTSKFKISLFSIFELCRWVTTIKALVQEETEIKKFFLQTMKLTFLRTFWSKKPKISNGIADQEKFKELDINNSQSDKYYTYRIVSDPPCEIFNNFYHAMVEFNSKEIKITIQKIGQESTTMKWEYSKIIRYGVSDNIFSFETVDTSFSSINGNQKAIVSYFLTVNQQNDLKQSFEKYNIKTPLRSIIYENNKVQNSLIEYQYIFQTVKSDIIIRKKYFLQNLGDKVCEDISPVTNENHQKENIASKDISSSMVVLNNQEIRRSIFHRAEVSDSFSALINKHPASIRLNSVVLHSTNDALQESSRQDATTRRSLTKSEPTLSSLTIKNMTTYYEALQNKNIPNNTNKCINKNEFKLSSCAYQIPQKIPHLFIGANLASKLDHSI